jgi:hypothetical protein
MKKYFFVIAVSTVLCIAALPIVPRSLFFPVYLVSFGLHLEILRSGKALRHWLHEKDRAGEADTSTKRA